LETLTPFHMVLVILVLVTQEEQFKLRMAFLFAMQFLAIVIARKMLSAKTVMNVKMDTGILLAEKAARIVDVIQLVLTILHATLIPVNVSANPGSQDYVVTNVKPSNTVSQVKDAKHVIATRVAQKVHSVMNKDNAHVMITLKEEHVTVARKTNTIDIKDAWIVQRVTTLYKMQLTNIARSYLRSTKF
jgi:hypothetical protein